MIVLHWWIPVDVVVRPIRHSVITSNNYLSATPHDIMIPVAKWEQIVYRSQSLYAIIHCYTPNQLPIACTLQKWRAPSHLLQWCLWSCHSSYFLLSQQVPDAAFPSLPCKGVLWRGSPSQSHAAWTERRREFPRTQGRKILTHSNTRQCWFKDLNLYVSSFLYSQVILLGIMIKNSVSINFYGNLCGYVYGW